ncbi:F0F1 ATP synthase subunit B [Bauldia litoralis]|uniref:F0F1 ATP synthase subunit B n=1 Tax=Bauldia litoralis TaxID=665467 RepID=UPI0032632D0C
MAVDQPVEGEPFVTTDGTIHETPAEHKVFPPFDATTYASQLLWFAITFVLLYYLMAKVAIPRIGGILEGRRDRIAADLDQAERLKGESEDAEAAYEKALAEARGRASSIADTAREGAKSKAEAQRVEVEASLAGKLADAESRIAEIKNQALAEVGTIAGEAADAVVNSLIDANVSAEEVKEAVADVIAARNANA